MKTAAEPSATSQVSWLPLMAESGDPEREPEGDVT